MIKRIISFFQFSLFFKKKKENISFCKLCSWLFEINNCNDKHFDNEIIICSDSEFKITKNDEVWKNRSKFEEIWKIEVFNQKLILN